MRAAVVIGVDKVDGSLPRLQAAATGAAEVAEWLRRSDYEVSLFNDKDGPVTRSAIFEAVTTLVRRGTVQQLVIYFAGHGFLKGPLDEYWLLSRAPVDPSEAVNVTYSAAAARYRSIPQIIFISDACRVVPQGNVHSGITGGSIVPNFEPSRSSAEIDFYYATQPGDPAHERTSTEAERAHGLFTKELLDAHKAAPREALLTIGNRVYVRNDWLKNVLEDRVSTRAETISLRLTQSPDVQIQIRNGFIALNEGGDGEAGDLFHGSIAESENRVAKEAQHSVRQTKRGMPRTASLRPSASPLSTRSQVRTNIVRDAARGQKNFKDRLHFLQQAEQAASSQPHSFMEEPRLTCVGDIIDAVSLGAGLQTGLRFRAPDPVLRFHLSGQASQVAVQFSDGTGMLLPVLREFACEVVRHEGRTLSINYSWLPYREPELGGLRAEVLSAATLGLLSPSRDSARALAQRLRQAKRYDPILGLVAALAYTLAGDAEGAGSVRQYMRRDLQVDLFDSWLLGGGGAGLPIHPPLPLLAQSWTFLEVFSIRFPEELKQLRRVPGFWTVFEAGSMERIMKLASESPQEWLQHD